MNNRIFEIDQKLKDIAVRGKVASESYKVFLRVGYALLVKEKTRLINSAQKKEEEKNQIRF
jgi:hypothetical protein